MIEIGVLIFGVITGNVLLAVGWIMLKAYNYIPVDYVEVSAVALMALSVARKFITIGGNK